MAKSRSPVAEPHRFISIRGAREHNLKNVDLDLPRDRLVVITGLSGSGKSSLAFDTIYAEGQRRYVESLSAYARQFLELMQKPDVDSIEGLSPAISIEQKTTSRNPRSTVGTVTEIYDYLRLLFARVGVPYSPATGLPIESQTVSQMVDRIKTMADGTRLYLMAPIVRGRKGEYRKELQELQKKGFQRVKIDGKLYEIAEAPALDKKYKHDIDVVVDRIVVRARPRQPPGRFDRDGAQSRRRPRRRRERRQRRAHGLLGALRLPGLRLHHRGDRAAAVLLQRAAGRLPGLRWPGRKDVLRSGDGGAGRPAVAGRGRGRAVGRFVGPVLHADAGEHRQALQGQDVDAVARPAEEGARHHPVRQRRRIDRHALRRRHPPVPDHQAVRGRDPQPRPALEGDRFVLGARGARALPAREQVRDLRRRPAEARGAGGEDRRPQHQPDDRVLDRRRGEVVPRAVAQAHAQAERDRRPHPQGDQRAAGLPRQCRPVLPDAEPHLRHAVGRREPAHPPGLADRLGPDRRALRAGRAVDRPAPARQRPPAEDADAPARPRQHGARGRARRGRDPLRRPPGRHGPGRRRPWRQRHRRGHARGGDAQQRQPDRPVSLGLPPDPDPQGAARAAAPRAAAG